MSVQPNISDFSLINQSVEQLVNLYEKKKQIEADKLNEQSELYEDYTEKVFDKTIK